MRFERGLVIVSAVAAFHDGRDEIVDSLQTAKPMPIAIFHGMTSDAAFEQAECDFLKKALPEWPCYPVEYAANTETIYIPVATQARRACQNLQKHEAFKDAPEMTIIGHSNGGMVGRWVLQNCEFKGKVSHFISVGGPQRGITKIPRDNVPPSLVPMLDWIIKEAYLYSWIQNAVGPAGYVYNPESKESFEAFQKANTFLGLLNNEAEKKDMKQRDKVLQLKSMLLVRFGQDGVVVPNASEWFGQSQPDGKVHKLEESGSFYDDDLIGLKTLQQTGRLKFYTAPRIHDRPTDEDRMLSYVSLLNGVFPSDDMGYYNGTAPKADVFDVDGKIIYI